MGKKGSILYSSGNFAASLMGSVFSTYVIFYYVDVLRMPAHLIGLAMGIFGVWNAINDPLLGQLSDRTNSRWGRRIPYIMFGAIPLAFFFSLIWNPPFKWIGSGVATMLAYFITIVFLFDTLYTLVIINWTSLFPEMYKTQAERTKVSVYRQIFGIVGNIFGVALPPILYTMIGWPAIGGVFGLLTLFFIGISLVGSREDRSFSGGGLPFIRSLKETFTNKSFLIFIIAALFLQFTFVTIQAVLPFYAKYVVKIEGFKVSLLLGAIFVMAVLWVNFWGSMANRKGSKETVIKSALFYGLALIPFWFTESFTGAIIATSCLGIGLAGLMALLDVMLADIIDEDEIETGFRREGMYFGINGFIARLTISLQSVIMGTVLKMSGYNANLGINVQPSGAILGIKSILVIIPLFAVGFAVTFFWKYPLCGDKLLAVKEKIKLLHGGEEHPVAGGQQH